MTAPRSCQSGLEIWIVALGKSAAVMTFCWYNLGSYCVTHQCDSRSVPPGFVHLFFHKTLDVSFKSILKYFGTKCLSRRLVKFRVQSLTSNSEECSLISTLVFYEAASFKVAISGQGIGWESVGKHSNKYFENPCIYKAKTWLFIVCHRPKQNNSDVTSYWLWACRWWNEAIWP